MKTTPKIFFIELGAILAMYVSSIAFLNLVFGIINKLIVDSVNRNYYGIYAFDSMRFAVSTLIISIPILIYLYYLSNKEEKLNLELKHTLFKKWINHLTIFVSGITIIVDLITLINTFLSGELTSRFVLKFFAVLIVAIAIFYFYLRKVKTDNVLGKFGKVYAYSVSGIVLVFIIIAIIFTGSPMKKRLMRFDDQKKNDLSSIQYSIIDYWQKNGDIPETLKDVNVPAYNYEDPAYTKIDPQSGKPYEYRKKDINAFEICADFNMSTDEYESYSNEKMNQNRYLIPSDIKMDQGINNWRHEKGRHCFNRVIDARIYPVYKANSVID